MASIGRKTKKEDNAKISGLHIYIDKNGRTIYYNIFDHTGYIIDGYEKTYRTLSMRYLVGGLAAVLSYSFDFGWLVACILGVAAWLLMEMRFRKFLKGMPKIEKFKRDKRVTFLEISAKEDPKKLLLKVGLWFVFGVCLVINAHEKGYEGYMLYLNYVIAAVSVVFAIAYAFGFFKSKSVTKG